MGSPEFAQGLNQAVIKPSALLALHAAAMNADPPVQNDDGDLVQPGMKNKPMTRAGDVSLLQYFANAITLATIRKPTNVLSDKPAEAGERQAISALGVIMSEDTVLAIWIEKESGDYRVETMGPADLHSRSYREEVVITLASDPIELTIIPLTQLADDWAQNEIVRLRSLSLDIKSRAPKSYFC